MSSETRWKVVRFGDGTYGVFKRNKDGVIVYSEHLFRFNVVQERFVAHEDAVRRADELNGKPGIPQVTDDYEFEKRTGHVRMTPEMRNALYDILVKGKRWKPTSQAHGVTESGILRAMRRVAELNHA